MKRTLFTIATLAALASTAVALEIKKDHHMDQKKPPPEQRVDHAIGLSDSLTSAPAEDADAALAQPQGPGSGQALQGVWQPPPAE